MPELNRIENYPSALSGNEIIPPARNITLSETDSFNQPWSVSSIKPKKNEYRVRFEADTPAWIHKVVSKLNEFLNYEEDWDSYGAELIDFNSSVFVLEMLRELVDMDIPEPSIVPSSDGGIQLEWHIKDTSLELKMMPNRDVEYYFDDDRDEFEEKEDEFVFNRTQLPGDFIDCVNGFLICISNR